MNPQILLNTGSKNLTEKSHCLIYSFWTFLWVSESILESKSCIPDSAMCYKVHLLFALALKSNVHCYFSMLGVNWFFWPLGMILLYKTRKDGRQIWPSHIILLYISKYASPFGSMKQKKRTIRVKIKTHECK